MYGGLSLAAKFTGTIKCNGVARTYLIENNKKNDE